MGDNNSKNRTKYSFKGLIGFFKRVGLITFTLGVWSWIVWALIWVLGAFGWFLLAHIWRKKLFVSQAVHSTAYAFLLALGWAFVIWVIMFIWKRYYYYRYYRKNKRKLRMPVGNAPILAWKELSLGAIDLEKIMTDRSTYQEFNKNLFGNLSSEKEKAYSTTSASMIMKKNFYGPKKNIIVYAGEEITPEVTKRIVDEGLYWEFVNQMFEYAPVEEESK